MNLKRKKKFKKEILIILLFGGMIALVFYFAMDRSYFFWERPLKEVSNNIGSFLEEPFKTKQTNLLDLPLSDEKEREIKDLKKLLDLKSTLSSFAIIYATTIYRNVDYFNEVITIDKGESSGVRPDMAVVTSSGLVGKVEKVTPTSSEVRLLTTSKGMQISVSILSQENTYYGILSSYDYSKNSFYITGIPASSPIDEGSTVTTSGLGGVFPSGLFIGTVTNTVNDSYGITKTIEVKSEANFNDLKYVAILQKEEAAS